MLTKSFSQKSHGKKNPGGVTTFPNKFLLEMAMEHPGRDHSLFAENSGLARSVRKSEYIWKFRKIASQPIYHLCILPAALVQTISHSLLFPIMNYKACLSLICLFLFCFCFSTLALKPMV